MTHPFPTRLSSDLAQAGNRLEKPSPAAPTTPARSRDRRPIVCVMILSSAPRGSPLSAEGAERRESRLPVCVRSVLIRTMFGMRIGGRRIRRRRRLTFGLHFFASAYLALGILVAATVRHI